MGERIQQPNVSDLMVKDVITVSSQMTLEEVIDLLVKRGIPGAPVVERNGGKSELLGFISEKDCLEYLSNDIFCGNPDVTVQTMMTRFPLCVSPNTDIFAIAGVFTQHAYRHLPVVREKELLGILGRRDVLRGLRDYLRATLKTKGKEKFRRDFSEIANLRFMIK